MTRHSVALVTQGFHPGGGGVTSVARWLRDELVASLDYDVVVFVLATSRTDPYSRRLLNPMTWVRTSLRSAGGDGTVTHWGANLVEIEAMRYRPRRELTRALDAHDLVQVVAGSPALGRACVKTRRPVVIQAATTAAWERRSRMGSFRRSVRWWHRLMTVVVSRAERKAVARADAVMVENPQMLSHVRDLPHRHVRLAPPGVDVARLRPLTPWSPDGYLLSLCRLNEPRKGIDRLLRAYALFRTTYPGAPKLVLAGRGELPAHLRALITRDGLEPWVEVRNDVPAEGLTELFDGASVYWQASHEEGLGISVVEAMACGLPVVATETAGSSQVVEPGVNGWLVPQVPEPELIRELVAKTCRILTADGPAFSAAARSHAVETFAPEVTAAPFFDVYRRLMDGATDRS